MKKLTASTREPGRGEYPAGAPKKRSSPRRSHPALVFGLLAITVLAAAGRANTAISLPSMGMLTSFAVSGGDLNFAAVTVTGDVGVNNSGVLAIAAASAVYGNVYLGQSAALTSGSINQIKPPAGEPKTYPNQDLLYNDLYRVSSALSSLNPFTPYANWNSNQTIAGNGGVNIIQVNGSVNLNNETVTLTGGQNDVFVINVLGGFTLGGSGGIEAGAGMDASRIIINIIGTGSKVTSKTGNIVDGTILLPYRSADFHSVNGALYAGEQTVKLMSDATVSGVTFKPPSPPDPPSPADVAPEPEMILLTGGGLAAVWVMAERRFQG